VSILRGSLLRGPMLRAAGSPGLRRFAERSALVRPFVTRFVAGAETEDALRTVAALAAGGLCASLDHLGENVGTRADAEATVGAYRSLLAALAQHGLASHAEVSVKLSALGVRLADGEQVALEHARAICAAAAAVDTTVTLDMEDHTSTDVTLKTLAQLRADFPSVGAVLQAYLRRTEADCRELAAPGSRVRLCKGAYAEPESVAFRGREVAESYLRCLDVLLAGGGYPMIATHDPAMITAARERLAAHRRAPDSYEFQLLLGVRPDEQQVLAAAGHRVRIYVPYGTEWYGYFMRRLAERPANLAFFLRALRSRR
jgi:proline dehydrogenase